MKINKDEIRNIYFVGAGGIGMAALERYFLAQGKNVAGYDLTPSELTAALEKEGVAITYCGDAETIPESFRDPATTLVVYTPAVPESLPIMKYFREGGFDVVKRAQLLGLVTRGSRALCFAGTHGKTTTSSMAAHIMQQGPLKCNAFLGGILKNYDSNFLLTPSSAYSVIEADEFDRSFHHLSPTVAVITATDPDHLDIYGTEEAYLESFARFTELIQPGGSLVVHTGLKLRPRPGNDVKTYTYSRDEGDFHASYIRRSPGTITFDIVTPLGTIRNINLGVPVEVNIENAVAAVAAVTLAGGFDPESIRAALNSYAGIKRRFETWLKEPGDNGRVVIDDYAHHPQEIAASIASVRALYPGRRLTVAFQPHLYTRTRDFAEEFGRALSGADEVILVDLYPAREEPIEGISTETIARHIKNVPVTMIPKENLVKSLENRNFDILLTMGAGDMVNELPSLMEALGAR